ncbi:MAG: NAD(P)/FAD-dependent oxidoreductase [Candidatus Marinimicrobia bacterium]|nr:NAD(P)/FAD-dependent oxidoreductase [Candidatus Neomarinimicrobiota bacterium]
MLRSSEVMHLVRHRAYEFGVRGVDPNALSFDLTAAIARKDKIVGGIISGIHSGLKKNSGITFLTGRAEFTSPVDIRLDGQAITADKSILAVGATPTVPTIPGLDEAGFITNNEALKLGALPASMIIIGGGYIGIEFAQMYARFGTGVTLLGRAPRLMPKEEPELSGQLEEILQSEGIKVHTSTEVIRAGRDDTSRYVISRKGEVEQRMDAEIILLATGRTARVDGLGLEQAGVDLNGAFLKTDDQLNTTAPNIWSLGDANGGQMFTHRATYDGPIAALNAVKSLGRAVDYRVVPRAIFTEPALASVGLTEEEARQAGHAVKVGSYSFAHSGRGKALGQNEGLVKLVVDGDSREILGGHILGPHADMLIHEVVIAMQGRSTIETLAKAIHIHPTLNEIVKSAAKAVQ